MNEYFQQTSSSYDALAGQLFAPNEPGLLTLFDNGLKEASKYV